MLTRETTAALRRLWGYRSHFSFRLTRATKVAGGTGTKMATSGTKVASHFGFTRVTSAFYRDA